jgi:phosphatidate cytidylyltransferase
MSEDTALRQRKKSPKQKKLVESDEDDTKPATGTPGEPPQNRYKKFVTRTIIGAIMIAIFTLILNSDHIIVGLFVIGLQVLVFREVLNVRYNALKEKELIGFRSLNWFFLWSSLFYLYGKPLLLFLAMKFHSVHNLTKYHLGISFTLYVIGFVTFILTLRRGYYKYQITQMTWTLMTLMSIVVQSTFIVRNIFEGLIWFLLPCSIIICNDIFAYFSGFFFGKKFINKPFLRISPNKTWEGFIGATFWTLLFGFYFAAYLAQFQWFVCPRAETDAFKPLSCSPDSVFLPKNYFLPEALSQILSTKLGWELAYVTLRPIQFHALVIGLFGSLIAPFGGFFASAIKRAYRIKDFDNIFPGHGGFTDRTDCQYIMGVFTYVYYFMFIRTHVLDVEAIFDSILLLSLPEQQVLLSRVNDTVTRAIADIASAN